MSGRSSATALHLDGMFERLTRLFERFVAALKSSVASCDRYLLIYWSQYNNIQPHLTVND
jgi:hypothetical protein